MTFPYSVTHSWPLGHIVTQERCSKLSFSWPIKVKKLKGKKIKVQNSVVSDTSKANDLGSKQ